MSTFLNNIDTEKVTKLLDETTSNVVYFEDITSNVVHSFTCQLDKIMQRINTDIISVENPSTDIIEKYFLELSNALYFLGENTERLGIYDAVSKAAAKEVYNKTYINSQVKDERGKSKTTVAELTALSENAALYEQTVNDIYNRAYKIVKNKLDSAQTMVSTLSKVLSKRMNEMQLTNVPNTRTVLNEGFQPNFNSEVF